MTTRTRARFLIATATPMLVAVLTLAAPAAPLANDGSTSRAAVGYRDVGYDPNDRPVVGYDPDIRSSLRRVYPTDDGRMLKVKVTAHERLGVWWYMEVFLDTRGGPEPDAKMFLANGDLSGRGCSIATLRGPDHWRRGRFRQHHRWTSCRVRAGFVKPDKRIRWRIVSPSGYEEPESTTERAPNHGWYP